MQRTSAGTTAIAARYHPALTTRLLFSSGCLLGCLLLSACAHHPAPHNPLAEWVPSANLDSRRALLIVLPATEPQSVPQRLDTLRSTNRHGRVSAPYLVGNDGRIHQLVADAHRAWHAGVGGAGLFP